MVLREQLYLGEILVRNTYIKKADTYYQVIHLNNHHKNQKRIYKFKGGKREIMKISVEISKLENRKTKKSMKPRTGSFRRSMTLRNLQPDRLGRKRERTKDMSGMREDIKEFKFLVKTLPQEMLLMQVALLVQ